MDIYIVVGTTGQYSDRREWMVAAYNDKSLAERHVFLASAAVPKGRVPYELRKSLKNPYDESMECDYTGVEYYVVDVVFRDSLPEPTP